MTLIPLAATLIITQGSEAILPAEPIHYPGTGPAFVPAAWVERVVGTSEVQPISLSVSSYFTARPVTFKTRHRIATTASNCVRIRPHWENAAYQLGGDNNVGVLTNMTLKASFMVGSAIIPATYAGEATKVVAPLSEAVSDILATSSETLLKSGFFYIFSRPAMAGDVQWPSGKAISASRGEGWMAGDATGTGMVAPDNVAGYAPSYITAFVPPDTRTVCIASDSIGFGLDNSPNDTSYIDIGLDGRWGMLKLSRPGEFASQASHTNPSVYGRRKAILAAYPTSDLIWAYGTNDFAAGGTLAQLKAQATQFWAWARSVGVIRVFACTLPPRVTTTDSCATLAGQTPVAGNDVRLAYNAWLRAGADGLINGVIDGAALVEEGGASAPASKWRVNGTPWWMCSDGIHPSAYGHQIMAPALYAVYPAP